MHNHEHMNMLIVGMSARISDCIIALLSAHPDLGQIIKADTLEHARQLFQESMPGLVLVGLDSVEEDAVEFLNKIRAVQPKTYCVAVVASPLRVTEALRLGVNSVLTRGFSTEDLMAEITRAFSNYNHSRDRRTGSSTD